MPKQKPKSIAIIPDERIIGKIYYIRGKKVYPYTNSSNGFTVILDLKT